MTTIVVSTKRTLYTKLNISAINLPATFIQKASVVLFFLLVLAGKIAAVNVTFQVDMSQMVISPAGVHLAGDFQGWNPASDQMQDLGGGIFSLTLDLPPGTYQFKFINGNAWGTDETVPVSCGVDGGIGIYNREVIITSDITLPAVCFAQCAPCEPASYVMNGNASSMGGDCYQITPPAMWQNGAFWSNTQIDLNFDFDLQFSVKLGINDANGADGVVFVLQQLGSNVLGASGGGMGYSSFGTSLGIEFDTFENVPYGDPSYDHISIEINGDVTHYGMNNISWPVQMSATNPNTEDGAEHIVDIHWEESTHTISVYFDCVFRAQAQYDLVQDIFSGQSLVFWGFTGATGGEFNQQTICVVPNAMMTSEVSICPGGSVGLDAGASIDGVYNWTPISYLDDPSISNPIATPPGTMEYEVTFHDLCNALITKQITVNVESNNPGCFVLPVSLVSFDVQSKNGKNYFAWVTESESQNEFFILEKSLDGIDFQEVKRIRAVGNSHELSAYSTEEDCSTEHFYFRLKQQDFSGHTEVISDVKHVKGCAHEEFRLMIRARDNEAIFSGELPADKLCMEIYGPIGNLCFASNWGFALQGQFIAPVPVSFSGMGLFILRDEFGKILFVEKRVL